MKKIKQIISLVDSKTRRAIPGVFLLALGASILEMVGLGVLPVFVKLLAEPDYMMSFEYSQPILRLLGISSPNEMILWACVILVMFFLFKTAYMVLLYYIQARFIKNVMVGVGNKMFRAYLFAPYTFHLHAKTGDILRNVTHGPQYFGASLVLAILNLFLHSVIVLGVFLLLLFLHPQITLAALIVPAVVAFLFLFVIKKKSLVQGRNLQESVAYLTGLTNQGLGSIKETHVRGCYDYLCGQFDRQIRRMGEAYQFQRFAPNLVKPIMELLGVAVLVGLIFFITSADGSLGDALPMMILFVAAIARLVQNTIPITQSLTAIRVHSYLASVMDSDLKDVGKEGKISQQDPVKSSDESIRGGVEVRNIAFQYPRANEWSLTDVSIKIPYHSSIALVGVSGSGKSTLLDILLGLVCPQKGEVLVDGYNINKNLHAWQRNIGYIPQTIYLLDESIKKNVAFGVPEENIDEKQVWEVLRIAQIADFVLALPDGLDTEVGERGVRISGGQKQRIGIARALYQNPDVLVMDEATSALDSATESALMTEVAGLKNKRTVIMVAHRLSTVKACDRLYLLDKGRVVASGTYEELLLDSADFKKLTNT